MLEQYGTMTYMKYGLYLPLQVLKSDNGYYIGTLSEDLEITCRESVCDYTYKKDAEDALRNKTFIQCEDW